MKFRIAILTIALATLFPIVALETMSLFSTMPSNLGLDDGRLAECPNSRNCVSSQAMDGKQGIEPLRLDSDADLAIAQLKSIVKGEPRAKIVGESNNYLHAEFTSRIFRFVDDVEFFVDDRAQVIHFRSASRVGQSDLGVNRSRMERIREAFYALDGNVSPKNTQLAKGTP